MKNKIPIKEGLEINNYRDYLANQHTIFKIIEGAMDLVVKEMAEKNPTFLIKDYDKLVSYENIIDDKEIYVIPIKDNKPLKVIFE